MNTKVKPFDNINVRKAVIAGSNRNALRQTRGGPILGDIATDWIPPGIPGFEEAGGLKQDPDFDFLKKPDGDLGARQEVHARKKKARAADRRPASTTGRRQAPDRRRQRRPGQEDRPRSPRISSRSSASSSNFRIVPQDDAVHEVLRRAEGRTSPICPNVGWFKDFTDPQSMLDADVQRREHPPAGQRQLAAAQRSRAINEAMKTAASIARWATSAPRRGPRSTSMIIEQAAGDPVDLGQDGHRRVQGRQRWWPTATRRPGPRLHLAEVGARSRRTTPEPRRPAGASRPAGRRLRLDHPPTSHDPLHHPPPALDGRAAVRDQPAHLHDLLHAAVGRPGGAARGPPADAGAARARSATRSASTSRGTSSTRST